MYYTACRLEAHSGRSECKEFRRLLEGRLALWGKGGPCPRQPLPPWLNPLSLLAVILATQLLLRRMIDQDRAQDPCQFVNNIQLPPGKPHLRGLQQSTGSRMQVRKCLRTRRVWAVGELASASPILLLGLLLISFELRIGNKKYSEGR